jgi:hypothetical protein
MGVKDITEAVWHGAGILFAFYVQYGIFIVAKGLSAEGKCRKVQVYLRAIGASVLLGFAAWALYGTHVEDADPLFGGGTEVVDSTPTDTQRNRYGVTAFMVVAVLTLSGAFVGLRDRDPKQSEIKAALREVGTQVMSASRNRPKTVSTQPHGMPVEPPSAASPEWSKPDYLTNPEESGN